MLNSTDFYKVDHRSQYPEGTEFVYGGFTPRSNKYARTEKLTVFGIQAFILKRLINDWNEKFFKQPKDSVVKKYARRVANAVGPISVKHIEDLHDLGYLPVRIKALPEGAQVGMKIPVVTIINTLKDFFWLTNYLETAISAELWQPMTNASVAMAYRKILDEAAERTGTPKEFVAFQGHDFSMRGMAGIDAANASGAAHLIPFVGSDTIGAIDYLEDYYDADSDKELVGCSVPATEHSVACLNIAEIQANLQERGEWNGYKIEDLT